MAPLPSSVPSLPAELERWLLWTSALSLALLILSALLTPLIVARLPEDYFLPQPASNSAPADGRPQLRWMVWALRNLLGSVLILLGVLMLVLPGQGILTILAGLFVMRFPAKRRLLRRALAGERARRSLNFLRHRLGRPPLRFSSTDDPKAGSL